MVVHQYYDNLYKTILLTHLSDTTQKNNLPRIKSSPPINKKKNSTQQMSIVVATFCISGDRNDLVKYKRTLTISLDSKQEGRVMGL